MPQRADIPHGEQHIRFSAKNGFWTFNRKTFTLVSSLLGDIREIWGMFKYVYADCRRQITVLTPFVDLCNQS